MRARLRRLRDLLRRYRVDRRLPPQVLDLVVGAARARWSVTSDRTTASLLPVIRSGTPAAGGSETGIARIGRRRIEVDGPLDRPLSEATHEHASSVADWLQAAGIDVFVVERVEDTLRLGIPNARRTEAIDALRGAPRGSGWYVCWADGRRTSLIPLARLGTGKRSRLARSWRIFHARGWGELAVGQEQAVELTFWEIGPSGEMELVGSRGLERYDPRSSRTREMVDGHLYPGKSAFPAGSDLARFEEPIDFVYTWVDGSDPVWQASFREWSHREGRAIDDTALDPARFHDREELRYSLRSVWSYCGWVRRIHIVTAGQVPDWLLEDDRVRIVHHDEILPAESLPTFNSHAIESALHRIDGLAEHFVYFNDDMFVGRSLRPEAFFTENGLARVFQSDARVPGFADDSSLAYDTAARRGREVLGGRFGRVAAHKPLHSPYPLRRSALLDLEREFASEIAQTGASRFRSPCDLSVAASLGQYYALARGLAVFGQIANDYVNIESGRLGWHLDLIGLSRRFDTFCVNETRRTAATDDREEQVARFLMEYFPVPSPWERDG